jgi:hypothetical protein
MSCIVASLSLPGAPDPQRSNDELIAFTLIRTWALVTGRSLRRDVPVDQLSEDELIDFWADPLTSGEAVRG